MNADSPLIDEANAAADSGDFAKAVVLAGRAADVETSPVTTAGIIGWQLRWSVQAQDPDATVAARDRLRAALACIEDPAEWVPAAGQAVVFLADVGINQDAFDVSNALVNRLESAPDGPGLTATLASALINRGNAELALGHADIAVATFARAKGLVGDELSTTAANLAYNEAVALAGSQKIGPARAAYERAAGIWTRLGDNDAGLNVEVDLGYCARGIAACFSRTGRYGEALTKFDEAVSLFKTAGEPGEIDLTQVGVLAARKLRGDRFSRAELDQLAEAANRLSPAHRAAMLHNIGNAQTDQRDLDGAEQTFTGLRDWGAAIKDEPTIAKAVAGLAVVQRHRGDLNQAMTLNRLAFDLYGKLRAADGLANAEHNFALMLDESAEKSTDPAQKTTLRREAADHALAALAAFDKHRHSLPSALDRQQLFRAVFAPTLPATLRICMNAHRRAEAAAVVERARVQPVLRDNSGEFLEAAPVAACHGAAAVGGAGKTVVLGQLAEDLLGKDALWLGWWSDGLRLIRAWSSAGSADAEQVPLDLEALSRYAACLPIVDKPDLEAAGNDSALAAVVAAWRAARSPMLADPQMASQAAAVLPETIRETVCADDGVRQAAAWTASEVLWPLSDMLLFPEVREAALAAHGAGLRIGLVIAPVPVLARIPWAALPLTDPAAGDPLLLIDAAHLVIGLPASLATTMGTASPGPGRQSTLIVADSLGDLDAASTLSTPGATVLGSRSLLPATRHRLRQALLSQPRLLAIAGHVRPGTDTDPASAAVLLDSDDGRRIDPVTAAQLSDLDIPPWCLILGCDGSGVGVGGEWTGVLTGLAWAGASQIATSTVPVIDDELTSSLDQELLDAVERAGPVEGLAQWQRLMRKRVRGGPARETGPYRWATYVATASVPPP